VLKKVLIANRGEIARRVMRACKELGIRTVAVYSDADAAAPHVVMADEAVHIGPSPAADSYLRGDRIIEAARRTGADAVHPGYGFLSERASFARAVCDAGLSWIGPPAEAIEAMGNKTAARSLAERAGVPVVPGTTEPVRDAPHALAVADTVGYPLLLKAASGGGGRGMRVVRAPAELPPALDSARREALKGFGDDAVYIERYLDGPRHVEIQILADAHGTILSLGERECSIQRRHQKMLEEAPSVAVSAELRRRMGETAVRAARAAGYVGAGTCEFLLDRDGSFYFLEMNTRIQVEHPVTELVTGIDLVEWQLRVAEGERLPWTQDEIVPRGWAIECRITSEDVRTDFLPTTGRITALEPPAGPGVRWDSGIEVGTEVGLYYDSLLAKLIVWGPTRDGAIARMRRALGELVVEGVETARDLHVRILDDAEFRRGAVDIQWLERRMASLTAPARDPDRIFAAAVAAAILASEKRGGQEPASAATATAATSTWAAAARRNALRSPLPLRSRHPE
jgi:acetyl-CoA carboxylase biotin carboxylase subunit